MARAWRSKWRTGIALVAVCAFAVLGSVASAAKQVAPGALERSFAHGGVAALGPGTRLFGVAVQSDGKIAAAGESGAGANTRLLLARWLPSGALDRSFGHGGLVRGPTLAGIDDNSVGRAVAIEPDGRIVVVGSATDRTGAFTDGLVVERFKPNGNLDRGFGAHGVTEILSGSSAGQGFAVAIERDGKVIAAGSAEAAASGGVAPRVAVVRLKANGRPDTHFAGRGIDVIDLGAYSEALAVGLQRNGKIVIAGSQAPRLQVTNALLARLTASGQLDRSFASQGAFVNQYARNAGFSSFNALAVRGNGSLVAAGAAADGNTGADAVVARFSASGRRSGSATYSSSATNFLASGVGVPGANSVTVAPGGTIFAAGQLANGAETGLAVWALRSGGGVFRVASLRLKSGYLSEAAGSAVAPGGKLVVAGDESRLPGSGYQGLVAEFGG